MRAAIFLYEAFVTHAAFERRLDHNDYRCREEAWEEAKKNNKPARKLEYLINALAHGIKSDDRDIAAIVSDEKQLADKAQGIPPHAVFITPQACRYPVSADFAHNAPS